MHEYFLHYLWKFKKITLNNLHTIQGEKIDLYTVGQHNRGQGPDFFNAKLCIDGQLWAGNIEIHLKSSDWYAHHHHTDKNYDNVILHVVWENDMQVFRTNGTPIPTLELKDITNLKLLDRYKALFTTASKRFILCENEIKTVDPFIISHWQERLYIERLEQKSNLVLQLLIEADNDWEGVLFQMLAKGFGLKVNNESFLSIAKSVDFSTIRKVSANLEYLEALLFGQAKLLDGDYEDGYFRHLQREYKYLKHKYKLNETSVIKPTFGRLRPPNFPTIRLAQLASLYHFNKNLFSKLLEAKRLNDFKVLFQVNISSFWQQHYTFLKPTKKISKRITDNFVSLQLLNAILPLIYCYYKQKGIDKSTFIFDIISQLPPEKNSIIEGFSKLAIPANNALKTQSLLQLKNMYCNMHKCMQCAIGTFLLGGN